MDLMDLKVIYRWTSRIIMTANLAFMVFVMSILYPFIVGNFKVIPPTYRDVSYDLEGTNLIVKAPIAVINEGFYDVNDLHVEMVLKNTSYIFAYNSQSLGKIPAGAGRILFIELPVDLLRLLQAEVNSNYYHFFNKDNFDLIVEVSCKYGLNTIKVIAHYDQDYLWEPLIKELEIYWNDASVEYMNNNETYLSIPFLIHTAKFLRGKCEFHVDIINDKNTKIGYGYTTIALGKRYRGNIAVEISNYGELQRKQYLTLRLTIKFLNMEIVQSFRYYWEGIG